MKSHYQHLRAIYSKQTKTDHDFLRINGKTEHSTFNDWYLQMSK